MSGFLDPISPFKNKEKTMYLAYLPPVQHLAELLSGSVLLEQHETFQKQTLRNRCLIDSPNGPLALTVPVEKGANGANIRQVRISSHGNWQHQHWQALVSTYQNSPYFEFYADDFRPLYEQTPALLFDFNLQLLQTIVRLMDLDIDLRLTETFGQAPEGAPAAAFTPVPYYQVFAQKHGFQPNLSAVDLLFNMGPESVLVLQKCLGR